MKQQKSEIFQEGISYAVIFVQIFIILLKQIWPQVGFLYKFSHSGN